MWIVGITAVVLVVVLFLIKAWLGRSSSGATLGHMSEQWLAENRNSHQS